MATTPIVSFKTITDQLYDYLRKETLTLSDQAQIRKWLTNYPTIVTTTYTNSWTPLHLAAYYEKRHIVKPLLEKGTNKEA